LIISFFVIISVIRDMIRLEKALDHCLARLQERFRDLYPDFGNDDIESIASSSLPSTSLLHASNRVRFVGRENNETEKYRQKMVSLENENTSLKQQILQLQQLLEKSNKKNNNSNNTAPALSITTTNDVDEYPSENESEQEEKRETVMTSDRTPINSNNSKGFREPLSEGEVWNILVSNKR